MLRFLRTSEEGLRKKSVLPLLDALSGVE